MNRADLILRQVRPFGGTTIDVGIADGVIMAMSERLNLKGPEIDGDACALIPGLADHHIHMLATAAQRDSVDLANVSTEDQVIGLLRSVAGARPAGSWIRAIGYDERLAGLPVAESLDQWLPNHKLRLQDRTGAFWFLNSLAIAALRSSPLPPVGVDLEKGHVFRQDKWLRQRTGGAPPNLAQLGKDLARCGITHVTDAGAHNGIDEAKLLGNAHASGHIPQKLMLMGTEKILPSPFYEVGPLKLHFDEHNLPSLEEIVARVESARDLKRNVAAHCVTLGELVFYLAALDASGGAIDGDRIEHGGIIPESMITEIATRNLTVVSQPGFIHDRGDRYLELVDEQDQPDLYRLASLARSGVRIAAGSDAPYSSIDPWVGIKAATDRRTALGNVIGKREGLAAAEALSLYLGHASTPHIPKAIVVGAPADLVMLEGALEQALAEPSSEHVRTTIIGGRIVWQKNGF